MLRIVWKKSACVQCPFNALKEEALARHRRHPEQVADAMMLEHVSLALNPRGTLYRNQSLIEITDAAGNVLASETYRQKLERSPWAVYRVRRIYLAGKDKDGNVRPERKGTAMRAVERLTQNIPKADAIHALHRLAADGDEVHVQRHITYVYRRRRASTFPTREEFLVAAPGVVETKVRYGLEWFEQRWENPQGTLFD